MLGDVDVLFESLTENASIFLSLREKHKYGSSDQGELVAEVLWNISDLLVMHKNKLNPLGEVSQKVDEDRSDLVALEKKIQRLIA